MLEPIFSKLENQSSNPGNGVTPPNIPVVHPNTTSPVQSITPDKEKSSNPITHRSGKRMPGREAFIIPSISEALNDSADIKENKSIARNMASPIPTEDKPFTQEQLTEVWKTFIERVDAPQLKSALSCRIPLLQPNWQISYDLDNELQNQRITLEWKPQLLGYLRRSLRNEKIEIEFRILDMVDNTAPMPYTEGEKWELLAQKYPALISLKNRFGLDFQ